MKLWDIIKSVLKGIGSGPQNKPEKHPWEKRDLSKEDYQLPVLNRGNFSFTAELARRQENEKLVKKYGITKEKEGYFL